MVFETGRPGLIERSRLGQPEKQNPEFVAVFDENIALTSASSPTPAQKNSPKNQALFLWTCRYGPLGQSRRQERITYPSNVFALQRFCLLQPPRNFTAQQWSRQTGHACPVHSWVGFRRDQLRLVRPTPPVLRDLQQQLVHEIAELRAGAVESQGLFSALGLVNLSLHRQHQKAAGENVSYEKAGRREARGANKRLLVGRGGTGSHAKCNTVATQLFFVHTRQLLCEIGRREINPGGFCGVKIRKIDPLH